MLFFVPAPYGRHFRPGWGPALASRVGWVAMESPSVVLFALVLIANPELGTPMVTVLGLLWLVHYVQRTFVFSLLLRSSGRRQTLLTVALADVFNVLNATGNAASLRDRPFDAAFVVERCSSSADCCSTCTPITCCGASGNRRDRVQIPVGGGFAYISAPDYLGEIVERVGFALAAGTLAAWAFALFTFANLAPRAVANHRWYPGALSGLPRREAGAGPLRLVRAPPVSLCGDANRPRPSGGSQFPGSRGRPTHVRRMKCGLSSRWRR